MKKTPPTFATEAELCAYFIEHIGKDWTAYAETAGFDILLVRKLDGFQIGIEAKLKLNPVVVAQALEDDHWIWREQGPDCRAVLVPPDAAVAGMTTITEALAITVLSARKFPRHVSGPVIWPPLPHPKHQHDNGHWYELAPMKRCALPDYVPDSAAGTASPIKLTDWKIKALKIIAIIDRDGFCKRGHFHALKIDPRRWIDGDWLRGDGDRLLPSREMPDFKAQHPRVFEEIRSTIDDWLPKFP